MTLLYYSGEFNEERAMILRHSETDVYFIEAPDLDAALAFEETASYLK